MTALPTSRVPGSSAPPPSSHWTRPFRDPLPDWLRGAAHAPGCCVIGCRSGRPFAGPRSGLMWGQFRTSQSARDSRVARVCVQDPSAGPGCGRGVFAPSGGKKSSSGIGQSLRCTASEVPFPRGQEGCGVALWQITRIPPWVPAPTPRPPPKKKKKYREVGGRSIKFKVILGYIASRDQPGLRETTSQKPKTPPR